MPLQCGPGYSRTTGVKGRTMTSRPVTAWGEMDFARRLRSSMEDFAAGDPTSTLAIWSPTIRWTAVGQSPTAGRYVGHDAVLGYLGELMRLSGGSFRSEVLEVRPMLGGTYVARFRSRARAADTELDVYSSLIIDREGDLVTSVVEVQHDEAAWDAFWSAAAAADLASADRQGDRMAAGASTGAARDAPPATR